MSVVLASGADERYGNWLLNMLGSVQANSDGLFDQVVVYDLGLNPFQGRLVRGIRGVEVRTVPPFVAHWRQGFTWKPWIWTHLEADILLWLDAGLTVLRRLDPIVEAIRRDGYFAVGQGHPVRSGTPSDYVDLYGLTDEQLDRTQIAAGIFGFATAHPFFDQVVVATYEDCLRGRSLGYSPDEAGRLNVGLGRETDPTLRDCTYFRWDQSILNIQFARALPSPVVHDLDRYAGWKSPRDHPGQLIWSHRRRGDLAYLPFVRYRPRLMAVGKFWGTWVRWRWWAKNHSWFFRPQTYLRKARRIAASLLAR
jgi:hypothetical protein